ncbi:ATP-binding protein [Pseudonocardia sp. TRM90224]|uniref:ATP-binding protein n=1 Tax=Pseudonocardia sp. TRM90224 TaxID=2812678 RepID=UPI001E371BBB|nr:AAA family ATPase [Pseudonocardia sp. TRM90224]
MAVRDEREGVITSELVGRAAELERVLAAVGGAPSAGLLCALVTGEPGIGKSRLLDAVAGGLRERGWTVLSAAADDLLRRIPYAALRTGVEALPGHEGVLDALTPAAAVSPTSFGSACDAVTRLLTELSAAGPVAVCVDDVDQLDDDSVALLTVVLRRVAAAPVGLVATVRSAVLAEHPGVQGFRERLAGFAELTTCELGPLSSADLGPIIAAELGGPVDASMAADVHRRADGNPFFATEITRSLRELDVVAVVEGRARLAVAPADIRLTRRDALLRRVAPLQGDTRAVAQAVSVLRQARLDHFPLLASVTELPERSVGAAFDELVRTRLLVGDERGDYRFSHALVADALYEGIGPAERRRLHGTVAARLLADRERGMPVGVHRLAWHVEESARFGDEAAVAVLAEAAMLARTSAPDRAAALCATALTLLGPAAPQRPGLLSTRCRALVRASRPVPAIEAGRAALQLLPPGRERSQTVTAVLAALFATERFVEAMALADAEVAGGAAEPTVHAVRAMLSVFTGRSAEALALVEATEALPMSSPAEAVVVFGRLAMTTSVLNRHDRTVHYADRALRAATTPDLELQAAAMGAVTGSLAGLVRDATRRLGRAEELARAGGAGFRGRAARLAARARLAGRAVGRGAGRDRASRQRAGRPRRDRAARRRAGDRARHAHVARRARRGGAAGRAGAAALAEHAGPLRARAQRLPDGRRRSRRCAGRDRDGDRGARHRPVRVRSAGPARRAAAGRRRP